MKAKNDFWTITGEFIYRHHVVARVKYDGEKHCRVLERGWRKRITVRAETHSELIPQARKIEFESCK